jgi:hypothetical protein
MILNRPSTASIQEAIDGLDKAFIVAGQVTLPAPATDEMIADVQTALDNANLNIPITVEVAAISAGVSAADQLVLDWLSTPEAAAFLGIPQMAAGGVVASPTLAMIGESGPEAVIPLGRGGMGTTVNVNVAGSVLTESEIGEIVQEQLLRIQGRNQTLEFA